MTQAFIFVIFEVIAVLIYICSLSKNTQEFAEKIRKRKKNNKKYSPSTINYHSNDVAVNNFMKK